MAKPQPQQTDPREAEMVEDMRLDVMDYIFGRASDGVRKTLTESTNTSASIGAIAYKATAIAAEKAQETAQVEMDMDMMLGVVTDAIDMTVEVAEAAQVLPKGSDLARIREDSLLQATVIHGQTLENSGTQKGFSEEQKMQAQADMRDYMSDGGTQKAFDYVNARAKSEGMNPYDMMRAGNEAALGNKHPLQDGITKGLMSQQPMQNPPELPTKEGPAGPSPDGQAMAQAMPEQPQASPQPGSYGERSQWSRGAEADSLGYGEAVNNMEPVPPPEIQPPPQKPLMGRK